MMPLGRLSSSAVVLTALLAATASATPLTIKNLCSTPIELWDNHVMVNLAPGASTFRELPAGYHGMFRHGMNPQATLAEFSTDGGMLWYDISIIPTGPRGGPEYCPSLDACKSATGGVGYNVPMQIAPRGCKTLTCLHDGCGDAYQYPKDDSKTTACTNLNTPVDLIFCPGGNGGSTPPPPPPPPPPTPPPTTAPPTAAPTQPPTAPPTEPPTEAPEPTTEAPVATVETPSGENEAGVVNEVAGEAGSVASSSSGDNLRGSGFPEFESLVVSDAPPATEENPYVSNPTAAQPTPAGDTATEVNTKGEAETTSSALATVLSVGAGFLACVAGVFIFVAYKKRKQLEALEPKNADSMLNHQALVTPQANIHIL